MSECLMDLIVMQTDLINKKLLLQIFFFFVIITPLYKIFFDAFTYNPVHSYE